MTQASRPQAEHLLNFSLPSDPGPYSGDQWAELFGMLFTGDQQATQGPFVRYLNELEVTDNGSTTVSVDTGAGMVNGHALISSEQETWTIPAGPAGGRTDRVVMVENNTNVEVTQSTAGRPLLFPTDLSEYTATPGVPAYSARLAILRGDDLGALPALDQANNLYMVELARYDINNVPTISNATDYRDFVGAQTYRLLVLSGIAYNITDGTDILQKTTWNSFGSYLPDAKDCYTSENLFLPDNYISDFRVAAIVSGGVGGNIYARLKVDAQAVGEAAGTHTVTTGYSAIAVAGPNVLNEILSTTLAAVSLGDVIVLNFERDATDILDTINATIVFYGFLVEYYGWSKANV